jgi:short-subunit dehydrogenase
MADSEAERDAAVAVAARAADDPWAADVLSAVTGLTEVSTCDVFHKMGVADRTRWTKADSMRISSILNRAGWVRYGKFTSGTNRGLARYDAPDGGGHD